MSANNAEPTGEVKDNSDEPILGDNGVNYDSYATEGDTTTQNSTGLNFDSSEYKRRQKTEYFVNVEGAEKRKRAEERRRKIEEKRHIKEVNRANKEARAEMSHFDKQNNRKDDNELYRILRQQKKNKRNERWRPYRKKIFISLGCIAILATIIYFAVKPHIDNAVYTNDVIGTGEGVQNAAVVEFEAKKIMHDKGYSEAIKYFEDKLRTSEGKNKVYVAIYYANFIYDYTENLTESIKILDSVRDINKTDLVNTDYLHAYIGLYENSGNIEEAKKISEEFGVEYVQNEE